MIIGTMRRDGTGGFTGSIRTLAFDAPVALVGAAGIRHDKTRDANDGYDGGWVAHPGLVPIALEAFERNYAPLRAFAQARTRRRRVARFLRAAVRLHAGCRRAADG